MLRLFVSLVSAAFLLWGASSAMASHGGATLCATDCVTCGAMDPADQGNGLTCAACLFVVAELGSPKVNAIPTMQHDLWALSGRSVLPDHTVGTDPPPPRG